MFVITEEGRVFDDSPSGLKELVDGNWVDPATPVFLGTLMTARVLSEAEVSQMLKSGR